jgi:fused signal recognition particle receptor
MSEQTGFFGRLRQGLSRSAGSLVGNLSGLFRKRRLDDAALEELEDVLIAADLGPLVAADVAGRLRETRFNREVDDVEIREALAEVVAEILAPLAEPMNIDPGHRPHVVLVVGVNGSGKTTTIGKMAKHLTDAGMTVVLAAGDTFRAAAIEQLQIWGERTGAEVVAGTVGADPAALAYDALARARAIDADVLLVDTAGRLQNKKNLMDELQKVVRVMRKLEPKAPHDVLLVLDATTGQNALNQVEVFADVCDVSGLAMTKLDGTARGGVLVAVARRHGMPIHFVGIGETAEDLQPFDAHAFARALAGLDGER